jgi:hypothetical protein
VKNSSKAGAAQKTSSRVWPLESLKGNLRERFLFVTNGSLDDKIKSLRVKTPRFEPRSVDQGKLPVELANEPDVRRRIGILHRVEMEQAKHRAIELLVGSLNVPRLSSGACHEKLLERVRAALEDDGVGTISKAEIEQLARDHHGLPTGPEPWVVPAGFTQVSQMLGTRHAVFLLGEPGVGKTRTAERLVFDFRKAPEPFALFEPEKPAELRRLAQQSVASPNRRSASSSTSRTHSEAVGRMLRAGGPHSKVSSRMWMRRAS